MIDYTSVRRSFETLIANNFSEVPVQNENKRIREDVPEYIALFDQEAIAEPLDNATDVILVSGGMIIQIFTPLGEGTERSREIASVLANLVNKLETDTLSFGAAVLSSSGQVEEADYYQQNLTIPYKYAYAGNEVLC